MSAKFHLQKKEEEKREIEEEKEEEEEEENRCGENPFVNSFEASSCLSGWCSNAKTREEEYMNSLKSL